MASRHDLRSLLLQAAGAARDAALALETQNLAAAGHAAARADELVEAIDAWQDRLLTLGGPQTELSRNLALAQAAEGLARAARQIARCTSPRFQPKGEVLGLIDDLSHALAELVGDSSPTVSLGAVRRRGERIVREPPVQSRGVAPYLNTVVAAQRLEDAAECALAAANLLALGADEPLVVVA